MKKLLLGLCTIFICTIAIAHTINWHVGDQIISTTTCDSGDSITPPTVPAKYGYHLKEWTEYIQLEYIESTGTQYIDTGIYIDYTKDFRIKGIVRNAEGNTRKVIVGNYVDGESFSFSLEFASSGQSGLTPNGLRVYFGAYAPSHSMDSYSQSTAALPLNTDIDIDFVYTASTKSFSLTCVANGQTYTLSGSNLEIPNVTSTKTLRFFLDHRNSPAQIAHPAAIGELSFTQGTTNKNYLPAKNSSNVLGMYDTVSGTFFTNAGTGEFIAGPEVGGL